MGLSCTPHFVVYFATAKQLKDYLFIILSPYIGQATLAGGSIVPAIFVGEPPVDSKMRGLAVNVPKDLSGSSQALTGGFAPTNKFEFRLIQYPGSDTLGQAKNVIVTRIVPMDYRFIPAVRSPASQGGEQLTLDQYVFSFSRSALIIT